MKDVNKINLEFQKAQNFINKFAKIIQSDITSKNTEKYLSFAIGHFTNILSEIQEDDVFVYKDVKENKEKPIKEIQLLETDFNISTD